MCAKLDVYVLKMSLAVKRELIRCCSIYFNISSLNHIKYFTVINLKDVTFPFVWKLSILKTTLYAHKLFKNKRRVSDEICFSNAGSGWNVVLYNPDYVYLHTIIKYNKILSKYQEDNIFINSYLFCTLK